MPSQALAELSAHIERQPTDHFGKFYLYATLLNTIAVRKKNFLDAMPVYQSHRPAEMIVSVVKAAVGVEDTSKQIKTGPIDGQLSSRVSNYKNQYDVLVPNFFRTVQNIFLSFVRKGQLSDLVFIIDKMNEHLNTSPMSEQSYNRSIYEGISFSDRKASVVSLLDNVQLVTKHAQNSIDNAMYGFGTVIASMLAITVTMALGGILLTLAMLSVGACAAFYFFQCAIASFERIEGATDHCSDLFKTMIENQEESVYAPNNLNFIIKGVLAPIVYTGVTIREQMAPTVSELSDASDARKNLDREYAAVEQRALLM